MEHHGASWSIRSMFCGLNHGLSYVDPVLIMVYPWFVLYTTGPLTHWKRHFKWNLFVSIQGRKKSRRVPHGQQSYWACVSTLSQVQLIIVLGHMESSDSRRHGKILGHDSLQVSTRTSAGRHQRDRWYLDIPGLYSSQNQSKNYRKW